MRRALLALALVAGTAAAGVPRADLVLRGGRVYTVDAARSWATAVAVKDGRIVYVGDDRQAAARVGRGTRVVELEGRMVLPGFHDSHMHPVSGGLRLVRCQLGGATTAEQLAAAVRACAAATPGTGWLIGSGWDPRLPIPAALVTDRPAYLSTADGFTAWVNPVALALAGIDAKTPDPNGGEIERDKATGQPTGVLRNDAVSLVRRKIPPATGAEYREGFRRALAMANRFGITSLMDGAADSTLLEQYLAADRAGELTARVVASQRVDPARGLDQIPELIARRDRFQTARLRADAAKIFLDGELPAFTAALLEPYATKPDTSGKLNLEPPLLDALVQRLDAEGFQVHMHVIGDRAVRTALDAFAHAREVNGPRDRRHHLSHVELIDPADLPRFVQLGVTANVQPLLGLDASYLREVTPLLGPDRALRFIPVASLISSGATVVAGSDWPAPSMNPLEIIQAAITQRPVHLSEMIAAYTVTGAWLARSEGNTGSIEVGKAADLIVLDRNLFEVPPADLHRVRVLVTLLEGRPVYRDPGFTQL
ncbi:MAG TPA: amidohydrolase [Myxococcaceae bacterium]|nr:amidohydrolase [Myxococcaceae bacterium]